MRFVPKSCFCCSILLSELGSYMKSVGKSTRKFFHYFLCIGFRSVQQQVVSLSVGHEHHTLFATFHFVVGHLSLWAKEFILFPVSLLSPLLYIVQIIREGVAYSFGSKAKLLVGYEEVRPVKRKLNARLSPPVAKRRQKMIHATSNNENQISLTSCAAKCSSIFWKWLFPLLGVLLLSIIFYRQYPGFVDSMIGSTELFNKIQQNFSDGWKQKMVYSLNFVLWYASYLLSAAFHFLRNIVLYPARLQDAVIHLYVDSVDAKAMTNAFSYDFLCRIPSELYNFGEFSVVIVFEKISLLGSSICDIIQQMFTILEWIRIDHISEKITDICLFLWKLPGFVVQILLTSPSYFSTYITQPVSFVNQKAESVNSVEDFNRQETEWDLRHLKHEMELLEQKVLQLRRERELEKDRYSNMQKALRLVNESPATFAAEILNESSFVSDELYQHKNQDFSNSVADLKESYDDELGKRFLVIERRLMERLDTLSKKVENELAKKITLFSEQSFIERSALSNVTAPSEFPSAVENLRTEFEEIRREKKTKIAQQAYPIISGGLKRSDDLSIIKNELSTKIKDDIEKELSLSWNRFKKVSHEDRETFRVEIMKLVEKQSAALFTKHTAEKSASAETNLRSALELSESDIAVIKKMITDALDTYDADKTGKVDYALESSGASVVSTRCTEQYKENSRLESIFGIPLWYSSYSPRAVIQHRSLAAGECWAFRGRGYLTIKLSHPIYVTEVSYEHLHSTLHPDGVLRSAPKLFQVYSYKAVDNLTSKSLIGQYEYNINGRALQTFLAQKALNTPISVVELVVLSNWDSDYTCLYRFRVHGRKAYV